MGLSNAMEAAQCITCVTDCVKSAQANVESPHNASVVSPTLTSKHSALGFDFLHTWKRSLWASRRSTRAEAAPQLNRSSQSIGFAEQSEQGDSPESPFLSRTMTVILDNVGILDSSRSRTTLPRKPVAPASARLRIRCASAH